MSKCEYKWGGGGRWDLEISLREELKVEGV